MLPFMRELLKRGTEVVLAVNSVPSINDITVPEMQSIMDRACGIDEVLCKHYQSGKWRLVSSGNDLPVIDLRYVSEDVSLEAQGADFVVLEGMGRGIETNLYAKFAVESLKLAMIKHAEVATCLGGRLYDCVCQYYPAYDADKAPSKPAIAAALLQL
jgi:damage-control phosphatase, subfamily II, stand-alone protein